MAVASCPNYSSAIIQRFIFHFLTAATSISLLAFVSMPTGAEGKLTITKECGELVCKSHQYCSKVDESCRPCQEACDPALGNYDQDLCEKDCQDYLHDLWYMRKGVDNETGPSFKEEVYLSLYYKMEDDLRLLKILIGAVIILSTCVMLALFGIMIYFKKIKNRLGCYHADGSSCNNNYNKKQKHMDLPVIYSNNKVLSLTLPDFHNDKGPPSHRSLGCINNNNSRGGSTPDLVSRSVTSLNSSSLPQDNSKSSTRVVTQSERQQKFRREPSESTLPEYHAYDNPALVPSPTHM